MVRFRFHDIAPFATILAATLALTACEGQGSGENEDLASAQSCLDSVPQSNPGLAESCLPLVAQYSSAQANALKCSIYMTSGGLIESKIVGAYNALKDNDNKQKEATFMALLSLNVPDVDRAYQKAITGNEFCKATGSKGLIYVGSAVVAGTYLAKVIQDLGGGTLDMNDTASVEAAVKNMLTSCTPTPPATVPAACTADVATLGSTTVALSGAYCSSSSADQAVCGKINSAVDSAGGDNAKVGKALYCYLSQKTYDAASDACQ